MCHLAQKNGFFLLKASLIQTKVVQNVFVVKMTVVQTAVVQMAVIQTKVAQNVLGVLWEYLEVFKEHHKLDWLSLIKQSSLRHCPKAVSAVVLVLQ